MTERNLTPRSVTLGTFNIERTYDAPRARVWAAFATLEGKDAWFGGGGPTMIERSFDFLEGGRELARGRWENGTVSHFDAIYFDIVPEERIVYAYEMHLDDKRISVSLATVEFKAAGKGTRLVYTEQGAFLDGFDTSEGREEGTRALFDNLEAALKGER